MSDARSRAAWTCERSVDVDVPVSFAWEYMTDVRNWDDPPAEFSLDGTFVRGGRGTTRLPGQPQASWTIRDLGPGTSHFRRPFQEQVRSLFEPNMEPGMRRIAQLMERRHAETQAVNRPPP